MTNYDRIQRMSVEEMAQELTEVEAVGYSCMTPNGYNGWKEYLLQEVSENDREDEKTLHKINHNSLCETETYKMGGTMNE